MPTIAWFYGIAVRMYVRDHPPPHFHAVYAEHEAWILIETGEIIEGTLPGIGGAACKGMSLANQAELSKNWCPRRLASSWRKLRD